MHAQQIQRVVDADTDTHGNHRQGGNLDADPQHDHQRLAKQGGDDQRDQSDEHRAPAAERNEAQQHDGAVQHEMHSPEATLDHDVGRRLDSGAAGREHELPTLDVVLGSEGLGRIDDTTQGIGLVIRQIGDHRRDRAGTIDQIGTVTAEVRDRLAETAAIARYRHPLGIAFEHTESADPGTIGGRKRGQHAGNLAQDRRQPIGFDQCLVLLAIAGRRLQHHDELIAGQRVVRVDECRVAVVARIRAQFRRAGIEIAHLNVLSHIQRTRRQHGGDHHCGGRSGTFGEAGQRFPEAATGIARIAVLVQGPLRRTGADTDVRQQHRNQNQFGEDQNGDANAGDQGHVADHRNVDDHQHRETEDIGEQGREARQEQAAEGVARGDVAVRPATDILHDAVHLLGAVRKADRKHQERHQNRIRIQRVSEQLHQAEQPDHAEHRAEHQ